MPPQTKRLEYRFETWLWRFRLIAILPVLFSLASTAVTFALGTKEIFKAILGMGSEHLNEKKYMSTLLGGVVTGIDLYLIGIALLIFGYGVYELLISPMDSARAPGRTGEGLLDIRDLDQLKEKLVKVLVVALIVSAFKAMLVFPISSTTNLLVFSGSVLLLALSAWLMAGGPGSRSH